MFYPNAAQNASRREFDVVLFWALDRFTREGPLETLQHLNRLSNYGVALRSFTEAYLETCGIFKEAVIAILGTIAKGERVRISERVRAGLDLARKNGTKTGRPIGRPRAVFRRDQMAELRAQGLSWSQIGRKLGASPGLYGGSFRTLKATAHRLEIKGPSGACLLEGLRAVLSSPASTPAILQRAVLGTGAAVVPVESASNDTGRRGPANGNATAKPAWRTRG